MVTTPATISILIPRFLLDQHGAQLEGASAGRAELIADDEPDLADAIPGRLRAVVTGIEPSLLDRAIDEGDVRWVHSISAGVEHLPLRAMADAGILLTSSAGAYATAMTEYVLAAMIMLARRLPSWLEAQVDRRWLEPDRFPASTLRGKQLGIVGYGAVGRELATAAKALGMTVWATKRSPLFLTGEPLDRLLAPDRLDDLLGASDFIVFCASLNRTTTAMIGEHQLATMKPTAMVVNVARGGLIDEEPLIRALQEGRLGGAMLDVTTEEPLPPDDELWSAPNLFLTPHISGNAPESWERQVDFFVRNLELFLDGQPERMGNLVEFSAVR